MKTIFGTFLQARGAQNRSSKVAVAESLGAVILHQQESSHTPFFFGFPALASGGGARAKQSLLSSVAGVVVAVDMTT